MKRTPRVLEKIMGFASASAPRQARFGADVDDCHTGLDCSRRPLPSRHAGSWARRSPPQSAQYVSDRGAFLASPRTIVAISLCIFPTAGARIRTSVASANFHAPAGAVKISKLSGIVS